jgi:hypothetical protein
MIDRTAPEPEDATNNGIEVIDEEDLDHIDAADGGQNTYPPYS